MGTIVLGKVESGKLDKGEALMLMPNKVTTWLTTGACAQLRYREMRFFSVNLEQYYTSGSIPGYDYLKYNMAALNSCFVVSCGNS